MQGGQGGAQPMALAFKTEPFHLILEPLQLCGFGRECTPRIGYRSARFLTLAQDHIGAHETNPAFGIRAGAREPLREALHHSADHGIALIGVELRGCRDLLFAWTPGTIAARDFSFACTGWQRADAIERAPDEFHPACIG